MKRAGRKKIVKLVSIAGQAPILGERTVDDPFERGARMRAIVNLRSNAIEMLHARGTIDETQYNAAAWFQWRYERASVGSVRSIDFTCEPVDGGCPQDSFSEARLKASREIGNALQAVGRRSAALLVNVVGLGGSLDGEVRSRVAQRGSYDGVRKYVIGRLCEALDDLCQHLGMDRVAYGPLENRRLRSCGDSAT